MFGYVLVTESRIDDVREQVEIAMQDGNYSPYTQGMANGLIKALAALEGKEPEYLKEPKRWLCGKHLHRNPTKKAQEG